jgi:hypothetical protein
MRKERKEIYEAHPEERLDGRSSTELHKLGADCASCGKGESAAGEL